MQQKTQSALLAARNRCLEDKTFHTEHVSVTLSGEREGSRSRLRARYIRKCELQSDVPSGQDELKSTARLPQGRLVANPRPAAPKSAAKVE